MIGRFDLNGQDFQLHIFIDKALIQEYLNDQKSITTWVYPTLDNAKGLEIWSSSGQAKVRLMEVWEMKSIYY